MTTTEVGFQLILHAGNSKTKSMEAIYASRKHEFEKAEQLLKEAEQELVEAHQVHTDMLTQSVNDDGPELNILLVHAQDHLTMAMLTKEFAEEIILLRKEILEK